MRTKPRKALMVLLLVAIPTGATLATLAAKRSPIERFEFSEVLNLKGNAQVGRHKFQTWADSLSSNYQPNVYQASAKDAAFIGSLRPSKFEVVEGDESHAFSEADHHESEHHDLLADNNFVAPSGGHESTVFNDSPFTRLAGRSTGAGSAGSGSGGAGSSGGSNGHSVVAGAHVALDSKSGDASHPDDGGAPAPSHDAPSHDDKPGDNLPGFFADNHHDDDKKPVTPPVGDVTGPAHNDPPAVGDQGDADKASKPVSVPEPSTLWLLAPMLLMLGLRRSNQMTKA
jgi:hypothetical protein